MELIELLSELLDCLAEGISSKMGWIFLVLFILVALGLTAYIVMWIAGI